jgi:hypothetical protein
LEEQSWWVLRSARHVTRLRRKKFPRGSLAPNKNSSLPGELYERQGKRWRLIGRILPEDKSTGRITAVDE